MCYIYAMLNLKTMEEREMILDKAKKNWCLINCCWLIEYLLLKKSYSLKTEVVLQLAVGLF